MVAAVRRATPLMHMHYQYNCPPIRITPGFPIPCIAHHLTAETANAGSRYLTILLIHEWSQELVKALRPGNTRGARVLRAARIPQ